MQSHGHPLAVSRVASCGTRRRSSLMETLVSREEPVMYHGTRRDFLHVGLGITAGGLLLPAAAQLTEASGDLGSYAAFLDQEKQAQPKGPPDPQPPQGAAWRLTEDNI